MKKISYKERLDNYRLVRTILRVSHLIRTKLGIKPGHTMKRLPTCSKVNVQCRFLEIEKRE